MQEAGSEKQEAINIQTVQLVLFVISFWNEILSTFTKTVEFMLKYPVLSVIAVQKPEINTGMSGSSVQEVISWIREFENTEQNFVC